MSHQPQSFCTMIDFQFFFFQGRNIIDQHDVSKKFETKRKTRKHNLLFVHFWFEFPMQSHRYFVIELLFHYEILIPAISTFSFVRINYWCFVFVSDRWDFNWALVFFLSRFEPKKPIPDVPASNWTGDKGRLNKLCADRQIEDKVQTRLNAFALFALFYFYLLLKMIFYRLYGTRGLLRHFIFYFSRIWQSIRSGTKMLRSWLSDLSRSPARWPFSESCSFSLFPSLSYSRDEEQRSTESFFFSAVRDTAPLCSDENSGCRHHSKPLKDLKQKICRFSVICTSIEIKSNENDYFRTFKLFQYRRIWKCTMLDSFFGKKRKQKKKIRAPKSMKKYYNLSSSRWAKFSENSWAFPMPPSRKKNSTNLFLQIPITSNQKWRVQKKNADSSN